METYPRYKLSVEIPFLAYARWTDVVFRTLSSLHFHLSSLKIKSGATLAPLKTPRRKDYLLNWRLKNGNAL